MITINSSKIPIHYSCDLCKYNTVSKKDYNKHLRTAKHNKITNDDNKSLEILNNHKSYLCKCGKMYKFRQGLYKHKQTCQIIHPTEENIPSIIEPSSAELLVLVKELMIQMEAKDKHQDELVKQNMELQNTMRELIPHIGNNNSTTTTNSNNTFNIQLFLETECKNAISIQDFIKSIEINMSHLVAISKDGYVDSISNVLVQALNQLAVTDRPLHCTDLKRETVYVKDMETWNKSTADAPIMNNMINCIENKHYAQVKQYVREHPQSQVLDTPEYIFFNKACMHSLGNCEDHDKLNKKIYKKVLPEVKLDKAIAT